MGVIRRHVTFSAMSTTLKTGIPCSLASAIPAECRANVLRRQHSINPILCGYCRLNAGPASATIGPSFSHRCAVLAEIPVRHGTQMPRLNVLYAYVDPMLGECWASVYDAVPTFSQHCILTSYFCVADQRTARIPHREC